MGLDITAYAWVKLVRAENVRSHEDCEWPREDFLYSTAFRERADGLIDGVYEVPTEEPDRFAFRAGSYGGYSEWRRHLCQAFYHCSPHVLWDGKVTHGPFYELIHFSDCEGIIGSNTSAKLAADFRERRQEFLDYVSRHPASNWLVGRYDSWAQAFELAAGKGAVSFH